MNDITNYLPTIATVLGIVATYYKIRSSINEEAKDKDLEYRAYVDKEIKHLREISNNQFLHLNDKMEQVLKAVEKLQDKD